jgi:hypothetical protein
MPPGVKEAKNVYKLDSDKNIQGSAVSSTSPLDGTKLM